MIVCTRRARFCTSQRRISRKTSARPSKPSASQPGCAVRARAASSATCSADRSGTWPMVSPVAGFSTAMVGAPAPFCAAAGCCSTVDIRSLLGSVEAESPSLTVRTGWLANVLGCVRMITGVDFIGLPTRDLDTAVEFYGTTLGLERSAYRPDRHHAEFETGNLTVNLMVAEKMGLPYVVNQNPVALHEDGGGEARAALEQRVVVFALATFDTGVWHMAFFADPD